MVDQSAAVPRVAAPRVARPRLGWLAGAPVWLWLALVVLLPNLLLIGTSFLKIRNGFLTFEP